MGVALQMFAMANAASLLLQWYAPQYSFGTIKTALLLFLAQFFGYQLYNILLYPRFVSPLRHLPQAPNPHWLWGQTGRIMKEPSGVPMRTWTENVTNNGLISYSVWFRERVLVTTPAALGEVLVTKNYDFVKPPQFRNGLGKILGIGILLAEGDEHKLQRKNLMPAFAFRHVKDIYPVFWNKSRELVRCLAAASKSGESVSEKHVSDKDAEDASPQQHEAGAVDVGSWSSRATLDIIGLSGMGQDFNSLQDPDNKLNRTYRDIFNPGRTGRILQLLGIFLPFWLVSRLPIKRNHELNEANAYIKQVCRDLISKKHQALDSEKGRAEVDILSVALESGGFKDEELVNQMMTFLVAGHETTATAMIWAMLMLCKHPDVQQKLRDKIRTSIPTLNDEITASQIDDCHYLQAVCSEVLRLWAPVSMTMRVADRDTVIAGEAIPRGMTVILCPWAINTSKHLWGEDAMEFKPERWLNADGKANAKGSAESNYAFLTFLHGPRSCIGQKFAQAEFACILAAWIGRYETTFEVGSPLATGEPEIKGGVTSKPKGGLWCKLKEVPGW
ncbi:Cytochrome P450 monooxygenase ALT8 [Fulvia fulva]|uniref:Cytochrome P450 monooxygenase ALT8 n=1 Tax=Passalora fulva TaxID=5499 RepID=A0A9Q8L581_PASFU|nr:Cytochrome P450 monooxygenase ALT8 [Fulvia fulva]KAK4635492.1 Cytochrome P450 monooxygenase ALT8 [Fulvia fulva]KAK4636682.1 Cytochrome P450 monooxygenase ALT8 [Fulvia fulva]UJO11043.1 Cytochrome P450 monooxygenase ALT8 [Fulvia fulva]WPV23254.1 Cytochrome P450 monooxygenase ALT8 [Fulvia fulva]